MGRCVSALVAGLAILLTGLVSSQFTAGVQLTTLIASMGASAVILFCLPNSPMARTWPLVGGHLLSSAVGVACATFLPRSWPTAALAVGAAVLVMQFARCLHPPGGASALIPALGGADLHELGWLFLLKPVALNVGVMLAASAAFNYVRDFRREPQPASPIERPPLERLGIRGEDIHAALQDLREIVDISEADLNRIYNLASIRVLEREFGALTCSAIMSRELATVEFGDELEVAWRKMIDGGHRALPVIDRARRVVGMLTAADFVRYAGTERLVGLGERLRRLIRRTPELYSDKPEVVGQIMSTSVVSAKVDTTIAELAFTMTQRGLRQVPIIDERDKLVGLVTLTDLSAALYRILTAGHISAA